jgi:hypothetical protein
VRKVLPGVESVLHLLPIGRRRQAMPAWAKVLGDGTIGGEEPLCVSWGLESLHAPLPLAGGLVGVLRAVVEVPVLAMFHPRKYLLLGCAVAFQLVGDDHPRHVGQPPQQLAEEPLGRFLVSAALHKNIQNVAILIDGTPQVVAFAIDREKDLIEVPLVARSGTPPPELVGVLLAKFPAPLADGLIRDDHSPFEEELFDIAIAEAEAKVEPDAVADDFRGKAVVFVALRRHTLLPVPFAHMIGTEASALAEIMPHWARGG